MREDEVAAAEVGRRRGVVASDPVLVEGDALGDLFLRGGDGSIHWLDTVAGTLTRAADDAEVFKSLMAEPAHLD